MAILVVDDSRAMRMIVTRELRKAGYDDVVEAENGAVALETINSGGVDLVLSDFNMPVMSGMDLLTSLRASGNKIAFGFVTSESGTDVRARALEVGAAFVITKPFTSDDFEEQIGPVLSAGASSGHAVSGGTESTLTEILSGLLGRDVTARDAAPPDRNSARAYAEYSIEGGSKAYCVVDMALAASLACALSRIPASQAAEWAKSHAFSGAMESNFFEVSNVMAKLVPAGGRHCVLEQVSVLSEGERGPEADRSSWQSPAKVEVEGYPSGRLGFLVA